MHMLGANKNNKQRVLETKISSFDKTNPFHEDYMLKRIRSNIVLISPTCFEASRMSLILQLFINKQVLLLDSKEHSNIIIKELIDNYQINKKELYKKVEIIEDSSNPFSNTNSLQEIISNNYLNDDISRQIDISATGLLTQTEEAKKLEKEFDDSILDSFPIAPAFFMMRHIWMPMSWRTRFVLKQSMQYNATYLTHDTFEADIHDSFFEFGLRDDTSIKQKYIKNQLKISIDLKPKILLILFDAIQEIIPDNGANYKTIPSWWNDNNTIGEIGFNLDKIADQLYSPPYYISKEQIQQYLGANLLNIISSIASSPLNKALLGGIGNIPLPFFIPNPVGLYNAYKDFERTKKFKKEHLWLIYLINIAKASTYFKWSFNYPIPNLGIIQLKDDLIFSVVGKWVYSKKSQTLHRANCRALSLISRDDVIIYLDDLGNWPMIDAKHCKICCK